MCIFKKFPRRFCKSRHGRCGMAPELARGCSVTLGKLLDSSESVPSVKWDLSFLPEELPWGCWKHHHLTPRPEKLPSCHLCALLVPASAGGDSEARLASLSPDEASERPGLAPAEPAPCPSPRGFHLYSRPWGSWLLPGGQPVDL